MKSQKPNYTDLGFSSTMGLKLRALVESQLLEDLKNYGVNKADLKFDWSESCIEGHDLDFLDGSLENYSGISVFDEQDNLVAEGWMDFIHGGQFFLVYWNFITTWQDDQCVAEKAQPGIPDHVWEKIPEDHKPVWEKERMKIR